MAGWLGGYKGDSPLLHPLPPLMYSRRLFLSRPNFSDALEMSLALFGGILIIILVPWIGAKWSLLAFLFIAAGSGYSSWYLFSEERMIIDAAFGCYIT